MTDREKVLEIVKAIAEAIRGLGQVPSGHLYAQVMGHLSLDAYNMIIAKLEGAQLIKIDRDYMITWIGKEGVNG